MTKQAVKKNVAAKKTAAPTGKPRGRRPAKKVFYVLSKRTKMFLWSPIELFPTRELAVQYRDLYETGSNYSIDMYKIDAVELKERSPVANEIVVLP